MRPGWLIDILRVMVSLAIETEAFDAAETMNGRIMADSDHQLSKQSVAQGSA
jgi:hypothetical protein